MGFLANLKSSFTDAIKALTGEVQKFANVGFLEGAVASGFVIAAADGKIDASEIDKLKGYVERNEALKCFTALQVGTVFNKIRNDYEFDVDIGSDTAEKMIRKVAGNPERVHCLMRLACVIGRADGNFDDQEKAAARKIAGWLGARAADYDL